MVSFVYVTFASISNAYNYRIMHVKRIQLLLGRNRNLGTVISVRVWWPCARATGPKVSPRTAGGGDAACRVRAVPSRERDTPVAQ